MLATNFPANSIDFILICMLGHFLLSQEVPHKKGVFDLDHFVVTIVVCQVVKAWSFFDGYIWHRGPEAQVVDGHRGQYSWWVV